MTGLMGKFYTLCEWITRFAYLNLLWIGFSILGLILFGCFPSTVAMFTVVRKWIMGQAEVPVFQTFWTSYKETFKRSNVLGLVLFITGSIIYLDFLFIQTIESPFLIWIQIPLFFITFLYLLMLFYVIPVFVHYDLSVIQVMRNALLILHLNPFVTMAMVAVSVMVYGVMRAFPGFIPFFGGSIWAFLMMKLAYISFSKIEHRSEGWIESENH